MSNFAKDTVIMVLASEDYTKSDYMHDYNTFKQWLEDEKTKRVVPYLDFQRCDTLLGKELEQKALMSYSQTISSMEVKNQLLSKSSPNFAE